MACKFIFAAVYLAVASGMASAAASSCALDIAVTYGALPTVTCSSLCPAGEDGFVITGVAYKRFPQLDTYNVMVRVSYLAGAFTTCSLVPLLSDPNLTASFASCAQADDVTAAPGETSPAPGETSPAPGETSPAPGETSPAPSETTAALTETSPAPIVTTAAPTETSPAPTVTTAAPTETSPAPTVTTAAPTETSPAPTVTTAGPTVTTPAPVAIRYRCKEGFSPIGASCYLVTPTAGSAAAGWQACAQYGGSGAVIETAAEQTLLAGVLSTRVWLAVNDLSVQGRFQAPGGGVVTFTKWNSGEPSDTGGVENCVMLIPEWGYNWNDDNCAASSRALCEAAPVPVYVEPTCAAGQQKYLDSCYFFTAVGDYAAGTAACSSQGGYPAVLNSLQEKQFLASIATETVYLGYTDKAETFVFVSKFGVPFYKNWNYGEPNNWNNAEACLQMIDGWGDTWYDISCSTTLRTACEVPAA